MGPYEPNRLPPTPEAVLARLRDAEERLESIRADIRDLRHVLGDSAGPEVDRVNAVLFSGEGTLSAGAVLSGRGVIEASAEVSTTASGEGSGVLEYSGNATGHAPADPVVTKWLDRVKEYGPTGARLVETVVRIFESLN